MDIGFCLQFMEKCRNFWFYYRKIVGYDIPDDLPVDFKITMDHFVSHTRYLPPFDIRIPLFKRSGNIFYGFTNHFNSPYNCMRVIFIAREIIITSPNGNLLKKNNFIVNMG